MKKLLITMLVLMFAVVCCSCSPKAAPDKPKPNSDTPTLIVDPTDDAALSTTTFFSAENSTVFTTETTAITISVTDTTKQPTKTSHNTVSSKTAAKTTKATTKSETVTTKKTTAATTVTTRTTKKTTQTTVTVPTTTKTTKAPTTTVKPTTAKPTTTKTTVRTTTTTRTTTKATTTTTAAPRTMTISEAESYANAYLQSLGMEIDYSATPNNAAYLPPMTWDEGDTYEAMQARIRSHIDNTIAWRGLQTGDPMRAVAEYHPNEYDSTYGWLYILH